MKRKAMDIFMLTHTIAGLKVGMEYSYPHMINQSAAYVTEPCETDFDIEVPKEYIKTMHEVWQHLTIDECEYMQTGLIFYRRLVDYSGMMLHASAVIKDGYAYLFSAPSGTGKSTHTEQWLKAFPDARIINDDKPAIRIIENEVKAFGTPWSGKTDLNLNLEVPIGGICFIERSKDNYINKIAADEAISLILNQTVRPKRMDNMDKLLIVLGKIIENVNIYKMGCNISEDAAIMAYNAMKPGK